MTVIGYIDGKHYQSLFEEYGEKRVMDALFDFGLQQYPIIKRVRASLSSLPQPIVDCVRSHYSTRGYTINDTQMQGLEYALKNNMSKEVSIAIWEWLSKAVSNGVDWSKLRYDYFYRTAYTGTTESRCSDQYSAAAGRKSGHRRGLFSVLPGIRGTPEPL